MLTYIIIIICMLHLIHINTLNYMNRFFVVTVILIVTTILQAKHLHKEKYYQNIIYNKFKGQTEYKLSDKTRVDCLTSTLAIEKRGSDPN